MGWNYICPRCIHPFCLGRPGSFCGDCGSQLRSWAFHQVRLKCVLNHCDWLDADNGPTGGRLFLLDRLRILFVGRTTVTRDLTLVLIPLIEVLQLQTTDRGTRLLFVRRPSQVYQFQGQSARNVREFAARVKAEIPASQLLAMVLFQESNPVPLSPTRAATEIVDDPPTPPPAPVSGAAPPAFATSSLDAHQLYSDVLHELQLLAAGPLAQPDDASSTNSASVSTAPSSTSMPAQHNASAVSTLRGLFSRKMRDRLKRYSGSHPSSSTGSTTSSGSISNISASAPPSVTAAATAAAAAVIPTSSAGPRTFERSWQDVKLEKFFGSSSLPDRPGVQKRSASTCVLLVRGPLSPENADSLRNHSFSVDLSKTTVKQLLLDQVLPKFNVSVRDAPSFALLARKQSLRLELDRFLSSYPFITNDYQLELIKV